MKRSFLFLVFLLFYTSASAGIPVRIISENRTEEENCYMTLLLTNPQKKTKALRFLIGEEHRFKLNDLGEWTVVVMGATQKGKGQEIFSPQKESFIVTGEETVVKIKISLIRKDTVVLTDQITPSLATPPYGPLFIDLQVVRMKSSLTEETPPASRKTEH